MQYKFVHNVAERFWNNLLFDQMSAVASVMIDFGFNDDTNWTELYRAYHTGVRNGCITAEELDKAVGNGPELTELVQRVNPQIIVKTFYD